MSNFGLPSLDDIFSSHDDKANGTPIEELPIRDIDPFPNHPFRVRDYDPATGELVPEMAQLVESIRENGVLTPALVRQKPDGRYELISGHRRKRASELAGKESLPCRVVSMTEDEATIAMVESNFQRDEILPSEKAFAYRMRRDAENRQGKTGDGVWTTDQIGTEQGDSGRQVRRYIRLTYLQKELLDLVDSKELAFLAGVSLSYLSDEHQQELIRYKKELGIVPTLQMAEDLRNHEREGTLESEQIRKILSGEGPVDAEVIPEESENETVSIDTAEVEGVLPETSVPEPEEYFPEETEPEFPVPDTTAEKPPSDTDHREKLSREETERLLSIRMRLQEILGVEENWIDYLEAELGW